MKTTKLIYSILVFVFASGFTFAQDDVYSTHENRQSKEKKDKEDKEKLSKRKINTGYVFIDGKYVEPPYKVRRKGLEVYINDIVVSQEYIKPKDPFEGFDTRYAAPDCLNENSTVRDIFECCTEPQFNRSYYMYMNRYFVKRYPYKRAMDSLIGYIGSFPNVVQAKRISEYRFEIHTVNGEYKSIIFPMEMARSIETRNIWGYGGKGEKQVLKNFKKSLNKLERNTISDLQNGKFVLFDEYKSKSEIRVNDFSEIDTILSDAHCDTVKLELFRSVRFCERFAKILINSYKDSEELRNRIKNASTNKDQSFQYKNAVETTKDIDAEYLNDFVVLRKKSSRLI